MRRRPASNWGEGRGVVLVRDGSDGRFLHRSTSDATVFGSLLMAWVNSRWGEPESFCFEHGAHDGELVGVIPRCRNAATKSLIETDQHGGATAETPSLRRVDGQTIRSFVRSSGHNLKNECCGQMIRIGIIAAANKNLFLAPLNSGRRKKLNVTQVFNHETLTFARSCRARSFPVSQTLRLPEIHAAAQGWLSGAGPKQSGYSLEKEPAQYGGSQEAALAGRFSRPIRTRIANGKFISWAIGDGPDLQEGVACSMRRRAGKLWQQLYSDFLSDTIYLPLRHVFAGR